jgi:hypothetical protein
LVTVKSAVVGPGDTGGIGGIGSSSSPIAVLLLLFIQINLKSLIVEPSLLAPLLAN